MEYYSRSTTARLYRWFYDSVLPTDFCEYARKVAFMYLVIIPYVIFCWPGMLFDKSCSSTRDTNWLYTLILTIFVYGVLLAAFSMIASVILFIQLGGFPEEGHSWEIIFAAGLICWMLTIVTLLIIFFKNLRVSVPRTTMVGDFVRAKKNKYCPRITWKNTK